MKIEKPNRVSRTYTQLLVAPPEKVFPLLCPVREADWIEGWDPLVVLSESGLAEPDCVFVTQAEDHTATWYITRHEPEPGYVEMIKIIAGVTAGKLSIQLTADGDGTRADITYAYTSLGPAGDEFIAAFTEEEYRRFMQDWEGLMNDYLERESAAST
ncbi:MAG: SRPBCC family protein [Gammaproteobacteria bacterium]|nr:SRPBCC family protein [Gammaproteobacteria bacterium]